MKAGTLQRYHQPQMSLPISPAKVYSLQCGSLPNESLEIQFRARWRTEFLHGAERDPGSVGDAHHPLKIRGDRRGVDGRAGAEQFERARAHQLQTWLILIVYGGSELEQSIAMGNTL